MTCLGLALLGCLTAQATAPVVFDAEQPARLMAQADGLMAQSRFFDAHLLLLTTCAMYPQVSPKLRVQLLARDAITLWRLGDMPQAQLTLEQARSIGDVGAPLDLGLLSAWIAYHQGDPDSLLNYGRRHGEARGLGGRLDVYDTLARGHPITAPQQAALPLHLQAVVAREPPPSGAKPWLAGGLNAVLPGTGFIYLGRYESAALTFVINLLATAAAVELWRHDMPATSIAVASLGSFFYLGGVVGGVTEAQRRQRQLRHQHVATMLPQLFFELPPAGAW